MTIDNCKLQIDDATVGIAGRVVFLVDESSAMEGRVAEGTKSKGECVATGLNSLLKQLAAGPELDVALVGYRGDGQGGADVGCRWGGALAGETFVRSSRLAETPLRVEQRVRRIPGPGGIGVAHEQTVEFPVWYAPTLGETASPNAAYEYAAGLLSQSPPSSQPPLIVSILGELSQTSRLVEPVNAVWQLPLPGGAPLVFHAHLTSSGHVPPTLYPASEAHLPVGAVREVFQASSVLPEPMAAALRQSQVTVGPGARGMVYHAKMAELIGFLSLVKAYASAGWPGQSAAVPREAVPQQASPPEPNAQEPNPQQPAAQQPATSPAESSPALCLVVLLIDRSVEDPADPTARQLWARLQQQANELLGQIAKRGQGAIEAALVTCGSDDAGGPDVQIGFTGASAGGFFVPGGELPAAALRVEETTEHVSNGIGGLIELTRKRPIFVDLPPTRPASPQPAFEAVAQLVNDWCGRHPGGLVPPIVLHVTRGRAEGVELAQTLQHATLYHSVHTDVPHRTVAYANQPEGIEIPALQRLWEISSLLIGAEQLAAKRPAVTADSRGIVINGKFDLLPDGILSVIPAKPQSSTMNHIS